MERTPETFQDRLATELRLAGASTMDQANEVLQEFLPRFNTRFAVAAEHLDTGYRPVPAELSLAETICIKDTRKVARDNTVKYHWRVLLLLPGAGGGSVGSGSPGIPTMPGTGRASGSGGPGSAGGSDAVFACATHRTDSTQGGAPVLHGHLFNIP